MDLSPVTHGFGQRLAGVLGHPFFAAAIVEIDYRARSVACFDPAVSRLPRGAWQPLTMKGRHAGLTARLDGNVEGVFLLDTGSTQTVHFSPEFVERSRLVAIRRAKKARVLRIDGEHDMMEGTISWFELGGHRFLREFLVVFNYPGASIALVRQGNRVGYPSTIRLNASAWRTPVRVPSRSAQAAGS